MLLLTRSGPSPRHRASWQCVSAHFALLVHFLCFSSSLLGAHGARPSAEETAVEMSRESSSGASRSSLAEEASGRKSAEEGDAYGEGEAYGDTQSAGRTRRKTGKVLYMATGARFEMDSSGVDVGLTPKGRQQVRDRVKLLLACPDAHEMLMSVLEVVVSPRVAAIETAIIAVAAAWSHPSMASRPMPYFHIEEFLHPGGWNVPAEMFGYDIQRYLQDFARKHCKDHLGAEREGALDEAAATLAGGYWEFLTQRRWGAATTTVGVYKYAHEFKKKLYAHTAPVLVISSPAFASYLFMSGLPTKQGKHENPVKNLQSLVREEVIPLNNAGVIRAEWVTASLTGRVHLVDIEKNSQNPQETVPYFVKIAHGDQDLSTRSLPNLHPRLAFNINFDVMGWASAEVFLKGLLPLRSFWRMFVLRKQKWLKVRNRYSDFQSRVICATAMPGASDDSEGRLSAGWISWMTLDGSASKGVQDVSKLTLTWMAGSQGRHLLRMDQVVSGEHWIFDSMEGHDPRLQRQLSLFKAIFDIWKEKVSGAQKVSELSASVRGAEAHQQFLAQINVD